MFSYIIPSLFVCIWSVFADEILVVQNDHISISFDTSTGGIQSIIDKDTNSELIKAPNEASSFPLWKLEFVYESGQIFVDSGKRKAVGVVDGENRFLSLAWDVALLNISQAKVVLQIKLNDTSSISSWDFSVEIVGGESNTVGLWSSTVSVPVSTGSGENGELFFPSGYGEAFSDPIRNTGGSVEGSYPSGGVAMQFMALCDVSVTDEPTSGFYMSALDATGSIKDLQFSSMAYQLATPPSFRRLNKERTSSNSRMHSYSSKTASSQSNIPTIQRNASTDASSMSVLSITMYPEDSGAMMAVGSSWKSPYSVGVGVISGVSAAAGKPLWYEASKVYREWALKSTPWASKTLKERDALPDWYRNNSIWINTHWQCHDVFNDAGGDPSVVLENTQKIANLLNEPSLALHWYEWQQGPDPSPEARYKFDTHYPDYFPPRGENTGKQFFDVVKTLVAENNVHTFPYINGRIFDINSESFQELSSNGSSVCSMNMDQLVFDPTVSNSTNDNHLEPYLEDYGNNCTFCVADPATPYWQRKIGDIVVELTNDWEVSGVYIDQIGAAGPKLCWDADHQHHLGGGTYWTDGYEDMLSAMNARTHIDVSGKHPPIVTENNAEPYMDTLQGYLVLTAYRKSLALSPVKPVGESPQRNSRLAPAFPAIYGGYFVGFGAEW